MKFLNKLERKFGKYAIPDLIQYVIGIWVIGTIAFTLAPVVYYRFFTLDIGAVLHGQIWRLFTFVLSPYPINSPVDVIWFIFQVYIYLMIGRSLENAWGTFRFNVFFISGWLFNILGAAILYASGGGIYFIGFDYIFQSMFFAFAVLFPNIQFLLMYIIPVKVKWLAIFDGVVLAWYALIPIRAGQWQYAVGLCVAFANFLLFYFATRNYKKISPRQQIRKRAYKREVYQAKQGPRHKCAVCGRTEQDGDDLEFRFCSKCKGSMEYCKDHLFTHEHIK